MWDILIKSRYLDCMISSMLVVMNSFKNVYFYSPQWDVNVTVYQISHSIMIQWENIKVSGFKRNTNQTIDLGLILDSTGRITMLFKHSPYSLVCLITEHACLFCFEDEFYSLSSFLQYENSCKGAFGVFQPTQIRQGTTFNENCGAVFGWGNRTRVALLSNVRCYSCIVSHFSTTVAAHLRALDLS